MKVRRLSATLRHLYFWLIFATVLAFVSVGCQSPTPTPTPTVAPSPTLTETPTPTATPAPSPTPTLEIPPTPTPIPTSSPTPLPEPTPTPDTRLTDIAFNYLKELSEGLGPRESLTEEEREAAEYLASQFEGMGYSVELQPFTVEIISLEGSGLTLETPGPEEIAAIPLFRTASGEVSGTLVPVGLAMEGDVPEGLEGKIAFIERGTITFEEKVNRARDAGATGAIIYNNQPGLFIGALANPLSIPAVGISQEEGKRIEELISEVEVEATILVTTEESPSQNVVAVKPGSGEAVVVLGGHYDTVPDVPGANDNASGTAVLLTLAQELSQKSFPFTLRFIAFGAEEVGLWGSQSYVESLTSEERRQIIAMLNFDSLVGGNRLLASGASELTSQVAEAGRRQGIQFRGSRGLQGGGSDQASFASVGIPVIFFFSDDFSRIHTPEDTLEFANPRLLGDTAKLALALLDYLAER